MVFNHISFWRTLSFDMWCLCFPYSFPTVVVSFYFCNKYLNRDDFLENISKHTITCRYFNNSTRIICFIYIDLFWINRSFEFNNNKFIICSITLSPCTSYISYLFKLWKKNSKNFCFRFSTMSRIDFWWTDDLICRPCTIIILRWKLNYTWNPLNRKIIL
jgi:hypothetical protein